MLESRGIPCVDVTKERFVRRLSDSRAVPRGLKRKFLSAHHKLPERYSRILHPNRIWQSPDPLHLRVGLGAFEWTQQYYNNYAATPTVQVAYGGLACLFVDFSLVRRLSDDRCFMLLQRTKHVTLGLGCHAIADGVYVSAFTAVVELFATAPQDRVCSDPCYYSFVLGEGMKITMIIIS